MPNKLDLQNLKKRKEQLENAVEDTKQKKEKIILIVQNLVKELNSGRITRNEYEEKLSQTLKNRSAEQWLKYYDDYIKYYNYQIESCNKLIKQEETKKIKKIPVLKFLILIVLISLIISLIFILKPVFIEKTEVFLKPEAPEKPKIILEQAKILEETFNQLSAIVGKPVKWQLEFNLDTPSNFNIKLPPESKLISVKNEQNQEIKAGANEELIGKEINVKVKEKSKKFQIIYETPAPKIKEEAIGENKKLTITAPIAYSNIFSYTELPHEIRKEELGKLKLYQIKNNQREEVKFTAYDTNENNLFDFIEFIAPKTGEYELVIEISKAEHLNAEKNFISDIYESVKALDNNWSEEIKENEYIRVTFRQKLDNTRDITIYPRVVSGSPRIEVYEINGTEKIAEFSSLISNQYNKILLTNLQGQQDVFDLRVINGSVEIDHIIDPYADTGKAIQNVSACGNLNTTNAVYYLNVSVNTTGTCFNIMANNVTLDCQGYTINYSSAGTLGYGVNVSKYNSSIIKNCKIKEGKATTSSKYAIYFREASNGTINNNTIRTIGTSGHGIYLFNNSNFNTLSNNTIITSGSTGYGILLSTNLKNNIINKNNITSSGGSGQLIYLTTNSNLNNITNNILTATGSGIGVYIITTSKLNNIINNTIIVTSGQGIYLSTNANYSSINNNTITTTSGYGIYLYLSSNNILTNNKVNSTQTNSYIIYGTTSSHFNNTIGGNNLAEGKPVNYTYNANNLVFNGVDFTQYGQVIFGWSRNITITNSNFSDDSLNLFYTNTSTISNNNINTSKGYGIFLFGFSKNNNLTSNNIKTYGTYGYGIWLATQSNNSNINNNIIRTGFGSTTVDYGYGIYLSTSSNNVLNGNNITTFADDYNYGIYLTTSNNNNLNNNNVKTLADDSNYGIYLVTSSNNTLINNNISTSDAGADLLSHGIYLTTTSINNKIIDNTIKTIGNTGYGIYLASISNSNTFFNNTITTNGTYGYGIYLVTNTFNNSFSGMNIKTNGTTAYSIYIYNTNHNFTIRDSILNSSKAGVQELYVRSAVKGGTWNFTNVTRSNGNPITINWIAGGNGTLNMIWYLDVNVTSGGSALQNANVTSWDKNNILQNSSLTGSNGQTRHTLLEYTNINNTLKTYYSNYTVNTTLSGYSNDSKSVNMSTNRRIDVILTLGDTIYPKFSDYWDDNATLAGSGVGHFNVTVTSTNGTVLLEINNTNITATNLTADVYNASYYFSSSGTYTYRWHSWGNGSLHNYNKSSDRSYTVNTSVDTTPPGINFTSPTPSNGSTQSATNVEINVSIVESSLGEVKFNWNGTNFTLYNDSLVLMMNFENLSALGENATKVVDVSKYSNNGTVYGTAVYNSTGGKYGGAYSFDGNGDYVTVGSTPFNFGTGNFTLSAWIKTAEIVTVSRTIIGKYGSANPYYALGFYNGDISFRIRDAEADLASALSTLAVDNMEWHFVVGVRDNKTALLYVDGNFVTSNTNSSLGSPDNTVALSIGSLQTTSWPFNGTIDEVRIWNRSLSASEIQELYFANLQKFNATQWYLYINQSKNSTTGLDYATYTYFASAKDTTGNENLTETRSVTISTDTIYPNFSDYWDDNATLVGSGIGKFNVTLTNTNGTVLLEINNTNITATNLSANVYNVSYNFTSAGTYTYRWHAWGNGSLHNYNKSSDRYYTVNASNQAPQITYIEQIQDQAPIENSVKTVNFNVRVTDPDGVIDIDDSSVSAEFSKTGETTRTGNCPWQSDIDANTASYLCSVNMQYYDGAGTWNIKINARDNSNNLVENTSKTFIYQNLKSILISPLSLTWPQITPGALNQLPGTSTIITNIGNHEGAIVIQAKNLYGETNPADIIPANAFTSGVISGAGNPECNAPTTATQLEDSNPVPIINSMLNKGPAAQEEIFYCIPQVPEISSQTYSTQQAGSWTISLLFAAIIIKKKEKLKKKQKSNKIEIAKDNLIISLNLLSKEIKQEYSKEKQEIIMLLTKEIKKKYKLNNKEIAQLTETKKETIPLSIFRYKSGALESICRYMKENLNMKYKEIANSLQRNERTIWTAYNKAKQKQPETIKIKEEKILLPISIFNKKLTILESIILFLKSKQMKYIEIAELLNRDQRNIWTIYSKAVKK